MRRTSSKELKLIQLKNKLDEQYEIIHQLIMENLESNGDKECDCQRICVLNALNNLEHTFSGIEQGDLK